MKATQYDRIYSANPVNATAAKVVSRSGIHFDEGPTPPNLMHWEAPPQTRPFIGPAELDMTGRAFGRFKVVGYYGRLNKNQKGMWLCRCVCGDYELRTTRAIANARNDADRCFECARMKYIQRAAK